MLHTLRNRTRRHSAPGLLFAGILVIITLGSSLSGSSEAFAEISSMHQDYLDLHNEARSQGRYCGDKYMEAVGPLRWSDELAEAAQAHASDAADNMIRGHTGSDGSTVFERVARVAPIFEGVGENVSYFTRTMGHAVEQWLESPGHCENIMRAGFTHMGTGYAMGPVFHSPDRNGPYRVVVFGAIPESIDGARAEEGDYCEDIECASPPDPYYLTDEELEFLRGQEIIVYGRPTCGMTNAAIHFLDHKEIPHRFANVDRSERLNQEMWSKVRATDHGESRITFPIVDVGGYTSVSKIRTVEILREVQRQEKLGASGRGTASRNPAHSPAAPDFTGPFRSVGPGVGALVAEGDEPWYHHRIFAQAQSGIPLGEPKRQLFQFEPSLFVKAGFENTPGIYARESYHPFWDAQAGVVWQQHFRLSAGMGQTFPFVEENDARQALTYGVFTGAALLRRGSMQYEVFMSGLRAFDGEFSTLQVGANVGFRL